MLKHRNKPNDTENSIHTRTYNTAFFKLLQHRNTFSDSARTNMHTKKSLDCTKASSDSTHQSYIFLLCHEPHLRAAQLLERCLYKSLCAVATLDIDVCCLCLLACFVGKMLEVVVIYFLYQIFVWKTTVSVRKIVRSRCFRHRFLLLMLARLLCKCLHFMFWSDFIRDNNMRTGYTRSEHP